MEYSNCPQPKTETKNVLVKNLFLICGICNYTFHKPIDKIEAAKYEILGSIGIIPAEKRKTKIGFREAKVLLKRYLVSNPKN